MAALKQAGLLSALGSVIFPKRLDVQVRTETLPSGQVQITPYFIIDGQEVPADLVKPDRHQKLLGYRVVLNDASIAVHQETQGRPTRISKKKAGEFLSQLDQAGVAIRSKDGKVRPRIETVRPDVTLDLREDDSLKVQSELNAANGVVLGKPSSLEQLKIKQTLADEIIGADEQGFKELTKEELMALFEFDEDSP